MERCCSTSRLMGLSPRTNSLKIVSRSGWLWEGKQHHDTIWVLTRWAPASPSCFYWLNFQRGSTTAEWWRTASEKATMAPTSAWCSSRTFTAFTRATSTRSPASRSSSSSIRTTRACSPICPTTSGNRWSCSCRPRRPRPSSTVSGGTLVFEGLSDDGRFLGRFFWNGTWRPQTNLSSFAIIEWVATDEFESGGCVCGPNICDEALVGKACERSRKLYMACFDLEKGLIEVLKMYGVSGKRFYRDSKPCARESDLLENWVELIWRNATARNPPLLWRASST